MFRVFQIKNRLNGKVLIGSSVNMADHWCEKGHAVFVLKGEFESKLRDGRKFTLKPGMCYLVADDTDAHRSHTKEGVKLLIVD